MVNDQLDVTFLSPLLIWCCYYIYTFMYPFLCSTFFGLLGVHLQELTIDMCEVCDCVCWSGSAVRLEVLLNTPTRTHQPDSRTRPTHTIAHFTHVNRQLMKMRS